MNEFQDTFKRLLKQSGKSLTQVASLGQVDRSYLMRLEDGVKTNPSTETVLRIWLGLCIDPDVVTEYPDFVEGLSELLMAATRSYAPSKLAEEKSRRRLPGRDS